MNRSTLIKAVQQSCSDYGYNSRTLGSQNLTAQSPQLPAALICEPTFQSIEGRNSGKIIYDLKFYLLLSARHCTPEQRSQAVAKAESDVLQILCQLSENERIAFVDELVIDPLPQSTIGRGEVGVMAKCKVVTIY